MRNLRSFALLRGCEEINGNLTPCHPERERGTWGMGGTRLVLRDPAHPGPSLTLGMTGILMSINSQPLSRADGEGSQIRDIGRGRDPSSSSRLRMTCVVSNHDRTN